MAQNRADHLQKGQSAGGSKSSPLRGLLGPVLWILALIACYVLIADWETLPTLFSSASAMVL